MLKPTRRAAVCAQLIVIDKFIKNTVLLQAQLLYCKAFVREWCRSEICN